MKKGDLSMAVMVILFLVASTTLYITVAPLIDYFFARGEVEKCRTSMALADFANIGGQPMISIDCPIKNVEIKRSDVYNGGEIQKDRVRRIFAEEMRNCWYKTGEGKLESFSENYFTSNKICVICSDISFGDRVASGSDLEIENFTNYLRKTEMLESDKSYYSYLSEDIAATTNYFVGLTLNVDKANTLKTEESIWLTQDYYVIFKLLTKSSFQSLPFLSKWVIQNKWSPVGVKQKSVPSVILVPKKKFFDLRCEDVYR